MPHCSRCLEVAHAESTTSNNIKKSLLRMRSRKLSQLKSVDSLSRLTGVVQTAPEIWTRKSTEKNDKKANNEATRSSLWQNQSFWGRKNVLFPAGCCEHIPKTRHFNAAQRKFLTSSTLSEMLFRPRNLG